MAIAADSAATVIQAAALTTIAKRWLTATAQALFGGFM